MHVELRPLSPDDAEAHCAGEDDETVRWLTGGYGDLLGTREYLEFLAENARASRGKRGFGVWVDGRLGGYVEFDPDVTDGLQVGDVNLVYSVHPWARGRGVAAAAVERLCEVLVEDGVGRAAAIRVEPENTASVRVAQKCAFTLVGEFVSATDTGPEGRAATMQLYRRPL